jgi:hypothetical protein
MGSLLVATVVFASVLGGGLAGLALRSKLPEHHQDSDSKDVVKLIMGLIATISALVLGLLINSARISFATQESEVQQVGAGIGQLDHALAIYGPEAAEARNFLRQFVASDLKRIWPDDSGAAVKLSARSARDAGDELADRISSLSPRTKIQQGAKSRALQLLTQTGQTRRLLYDQTNSLLSWTFLAVMVSWLVALFVGYGLLTRYSAPVLAAMFVGAFCVAGAIFLIFDLNQPYSGLMKISSAPIRNALDQVDR